MGWLGWIGVFSLGVVAGYVTAGLAASAGQGSVSVDEQRMAEKWYESGYRAGRHDAATLAENRALNMPPTSASRAVLFDVVHEMKQPYSQG